MSVFGSKKLAVASAVGGAALLVGGLFVGGGLVGAQEPTPTPAPGTEQQQQAPDDGTTTPRTKEECDREGGGTTGTSNSGVRGVRTDNSRYF